MKDIRDKTYNTLRSSERFFKTDMVYLAKGGFWLALGQTGGAFMSFLLAIAFAHFFSPEEYGLYKYILSVASILWALSLSGISTAVVRSVSRGFEGSLRSGFKESLKWSGLTVLASLIGSGYYFIQDNTTLSIALLFVAIFSPLLNSSALYASFLSGKKDFKRSTLYWLYTNIFSTAVLIGTLFFVKSALYVVLAYLISNTLGNILFYLYVLKKDKPNEKDDPETLLYGKHLSAMNIIDAIAQQIDKILIFQLLGGAPLAIYSFAIALPEQIRALLKGIARLALPKFSTQTIEELQKNIPRKAFLLAGGSVLIIGVYILAAPYIYALLFPQYMNAVFYSQIVSITILAVVATLPQTALQAKQKTKELYLGNMSGNIFQILANVVLISRFGLPGIIAARIVSKAFITALSFILLKRSRETPPEESWAS